MPPERACGRVARGRSRDSGADALKAPGPRQHGRTGAGRLRRVERSAAAVASDGFFTRHQRTGRGDIMALTGDLLIGGATRHGGAGEIFGRDAASGDTLQPGFGGAERRDVEEACRLAAEAFPVFRETDPEARATFLETVAQSILDIGDELIERCVAESGLPRGRIEGERGRTVGQLRLFAEVVREGSFVEARIDPAMPERKPAPRVDLRLRNMADRPGRGLRRLELPARLLGRRRRHRLGLCRRLPGGGQGAFGPSGHVRARRPRRPEGGEGLRPARGHLLDAVRHRHSRSARRWSPTRASRRLASPARGAAARR